MLPSTAQVVISDKNAEEDMFLPTPVNNPTAPEPAPEQTTRPCRNPPRHVRPPDRLAY